MMTRWFVVVGYMFGLVACSTPSGCDAEDNGVKEGAPSAQQDDPKGQEQSLQPIDDPVVDEPEGAKEEALRWMRAGPGALVVKLNLDTVERQIAPVVEPVAAEIDGVMGTELVEQFLQHGPLMAFDPAVAERDPVAALDKERAAYISRQPVASDTSYFDASIYGAVLQSDRVSLAGTHYRMLLPADEPQEAAEALDGFADDNPRVEAALTAGEHYLRVDVVEITGGGAVDASFVDEHFDVQSEDQAEQLLERVAERRDDTPLRQTPVLATFLTSTAPVGLYFRSEDLRVMQATDAIIGSMDALMAAAPERRQEVLSRGVTTAINALGFTPQSEFEHEDTLLELRTHGDRGLMVDSASTQTERGRAIAEHVGESETLEDVPTLEDPIIDLRWNFDTAAAVEHNPLAEQYESELSGDLREMMPMIAEYYRGGGLASYLATIFITPSLLPRLVASGDDVISPRLGYVAYDDEGQTGDGAPAGVGILVADDVEQYRPSQSIEGLKAQLERDGVDVDLSGPVDEPTRLYMLTGDMVGSGATDRLQFDAAALSVHLDLSNFGGAIRGNDWFEALGELNRLNAEWTVDEGMTRQRYAFGDAPLERPQLEEVDDFEAMDTGADCTRQLVANAIEIFIALEHMSPGTPVDDMANRMFGHYDELAEECADDDPHLAEHLDEVRARMRFILVFRTPHDESGLLALYDVLCEAGDPLMCRD